MKFFLIEILKTFWIPILFLVLTIILLLTLTDIRNQQVFQIVLGVMIGVILGFIADISKRGFDNLQKKVKQRKMALKLLEEDAKSIYRTIWLWDRLQKANQIPDDVKQSIPPKLDLKYWNILKEKEDFLILAAEEPFDNIFKEIWEFEEINAQINLAKKGNKEAAGFAKVFYKTCVEKNSHKKLFLFFKTEQEIEEIEKVYNKAIQKKPK